MSARQPFSMVPHGDFLARASDLEGDEIALFSIAFFLMLERGGPIDDDMGWLGRRAGVSTRRANQIRVKLLDQGKWTVRGDMVGDPAALSIIAKRNKRSAINSSNALARWDKAGQPELDFEHDPPGPDKPRKGDKKRRKSANHGNATASAAPEPAREMQNGGKNEDKSKINATKTQLKDDLIGQETAEICQSTPKNRIPDSRARATPESELESNDHTTDSESCEPRDRTTPLMAVLEAAGFHPSTEEQLNRARAMVESWLALGADLDRTILPTVRSMVRASSDPTSSLKRFDRQIKHEHARAPGRTPKTLNGSATASAPPPPDDADPRVAQIRERLRRDSGPRTYDGWLRPCRLGLDPDDRLRVEAPSQFMADWVQQHYADRIRSLARSVGIHSIMVGASPPAPPP